MSFNLLIAKSRMLLVTSLVSLSLLLTSCGGEDGGTNVEIPGVIGPKLLLVEDNLLISMVFENLVMDGGLRYNIPKYENSYLELAPDLQSGGTLLAISVSLQDVFNGGLDQLDPQTLPGGRNLPGVSTGTLPAIAFSVEEFHNMAFYLGPDVFGVFIPVKGLGIQGAIATFRYYSSGERAGNLSIVGEDENGENGGILLMLDLTKKRKKYLKKIAKRYQ